MKKLFVSIVMALVLVMPGVQALAEFSQPITMYVTKNKVSIHKSAKKDSDTLKTVNASDELSAIDISENGKWYKVKFTNKKGKKKEGWVQAKYLSDILDPSICKHDWSKWETTREATCSKKGVEWRYCYRCGTEEERKTKKLDHALSKWKVTKEATCTEEGERTRSCKNCDYTETEKIKKTDHDFGKWETTKEASCTTKGEMVHKCKVCGFTETAVVEKLAHEFGKWEVTTEATCTEEGEKVRECKNCDYEEVAKIEKTPHDMGKWEVTKEATCTEKGEEVCECKDCDYEMVREIDLIPHKFSEWTVTTEATDHSSGSRTRTCSVCGQTEEEVFDPEGTVRRGAKGEEVVEIQQLLIDQKYLSEGAADGAFGGGTESALMKFQQDQGFTADGIAWPQTINRLRHVFSAWEVSTVPSRTTEGVRTRTCEVCGYQETEAFTVGPTFARGARGEEIRILQSMLNDLKFDAGTADGAYGPKMDRAFTAFAKSTGFTFREGQVRPADIDALASACLASAPKNIIADSEAANLILTVTSAGAAEGFPEGWEAFNWNLVNTGEEDCTPEMLLLTFGETPDFRNGVIVIEIENSTLPAAAPAESKEKEDEKDSDIVFTEDVNMISGTFCVDPAWGEGDMHFCFLAAGEEEGSHLLSSIVTPVEVEAPEEDAEAEAAEEGTEGEDTEEEASEEEETAELYTSDADGDPVPAEAPAGPMMQTTEEGKE